MRACVVVLLVSVLVVATASACSSSAPAASATTTSAAAMASGETATSDAPDAKIAWDLELLPGWQLTERVCWSGAPMQYVMPEARSALAYVVAAHDDEGRILEVGPRGITIPSHAARESCVHLTLDLARAAVEIDDDDAITLFGKTLYGSPDMWLWRPEPWPKGAVGTLSLELPEGMRASLPWPRAPQNESTYLVDASTWKLMAKAAVGDVRIKHVDVGDATFTITRLPGDLRVSDAGLEKWLREAATAVSLVGAAGSDDGAPRFPVRHAQVLLVPVPAGGAIPFGMAMRGGGPTAMMLVSARAADDDLHGEWVGVHELSHLLLPPLVSEDAWLAEGLASYYQQTLRGRAGLLSVEESWGLLVDGFDRGRRSARDQSLREASTKMRREYSYLHVYWGGAAVMLMLDVELRKAGTSLDAVVAGVRKREPKDTVYRTADEVIGWMQEQAPGVDIQKLVERGLSQRFPPVDPLLVDLGVARGKGGDAVLRDDATLADIRRAILHAPR